MARPKNCRMVSEMPGVVYFKPRGIPLTDLEEVVLTVDEFEAIRLADLEGLYQAAAAERMKISRPTFGRILESAHQKVAEALAQGKALKIEGGAYQMMEMRTFNCAGCQHLWQVPPGTGRPTECPACHGRDFHRLNSGLEAGPAQRCRNRCGKK
ncbi:MAG: DUF134 domain-containing protein [Candidatus Abyssobacteria bacterium SURF_5]|uniref:UPF0251 protein C4520_01110 n=1 Tax=Abyssobacteria bacterium (strain SURF_5) TaxID=2093360 RepID=A0A3A4P5E8_ABYX5|nr:MAG: DUF134 domain-containing protein [Candidatus Abyssubacteria bacterium SURF_5]